tara:strand:+ start:745 stop:882 length:138 start_codon:yes stop_codon:yes gene_type:complete
METKLIAAEKSTDVTVAQFENAFSEMAVTPAAITIFVAVPQHGLL